MANKMTNVKALTYVLENCELPAEIAEKVESMKASFEKRAGRKANGPTKAQIANAALAEKIVTTMSVGEVYNTAEIAALIPELEGATPQKISPLMRKLGWPTLFCNELEVAENGEITGFRMRIENSKLSTVKALQSIGYDTIAAGDSFNDLAMIKASKAGFLFRSTPQIIADHPELPHFTEFDDFLKAI
jgi:hypothetical protein